MVRSGGAPPIGVRRRFVYWFCNPISVPHFRGGRGYYLDHLGGWPPLFLSYQALSGPSFAARNGQTRATARSQGPLSILGDFSGDRLRLTQDLDALRSPVATCFGRLSQIPPRALPESNSTGAAGPFVPAGPLLPQSNLSTAPAGLRKNGAPLDRLPLFHSLSTMLNERFRGRTGYGRNGTCGHFATRDVFSLLGRRKTARHQKSRSGKQGSGKGTFSAIHSRGFMGQITVSCRNDSSGAVIKGFIGTVPAGAAVCVFT